MSVERCGSQGKVFAGGGRGGETNHNRSVVRLFKANGLAFLVSGIVVHLNARIIKIGLNKKNPLSIED